MLTVTITLVDQRTGWHGERLLGLEIVRDKGDVPITGYTVDGPDGCSWRVEGFERNRGFVELARRALEEMPGEKRNG